MGRDSSRFNTPSACPSGEAHEHGISAAIGPPPFSPRSIRDAPVRSRAPGHMFPLLRGPGVMVRAGQTEAAVDLARMASVSRRRICEIMNETARWRACPS